MSVATCSLHLNTQGFCDIHDLTDRVRTELVETGLKEGIVTVFIPGSTASVTTIEFETGAVEDLKHAIERIAPANMDYQHDARWGDGNGFSHVRAALLGPSATIPFSNGELSLGTWQQIVLLDFDNRPRHRDIILKFIGE